MRKREAPEEQWRDIPGCGGLYQASTAGRIRKAWPKSGKRTPVAQYPKKSRRKPAGKKILYVHLTMADGRRIERPVLKLIAETFCEVPAGCAAVHRNGMRSDNSAENIVFLSNKDLGYRYGAKASRRPVCKVDPEGNIIEVYSSARAAGRANHMSYQTILDRCNGKVKNPTALDGFNYAWDEGEYMEGEGQ